MLRDAVRAALRGVQFVGGKAGNMRHPKPRLSSAHDLLKAKWISMYVEDGSEVLDVGCGNGRRLMDVSLFVRDMQGTGVELAPRRPPAPVLPRVRPPTLLTFDGAQLPFQDRSFDVVMICYVLHHLKDDHADSLLQEMIRVARRRLILLEDSRDVFSIPYRLRNWAHATEANLGYSVESDRFIQNFKHSMFKTRREWSDLLSSLSAVQSVTCVPLDSISYYRHHTMFIAALEPA